MENNNSKNMWIGIGVVVVLAIIIIFWAMHNNNSTSYTETPAPVTDNTTPASTQDIDVNAKGAAAATISYTDALKTYATRRIQLDTACQATPNNVTYKDNTGIMIDNRSPNTRTVKVGTTFTIKPWGFKIVVLPDIYLKDKTILIDCDKSQNVATILVQE